MTLLMASIGFATGWPAAPLEDLPEKAVQCPQSQARDEDYTEACATSFPWALRLVTLFLVGLALTFIGERKRDGFQLASSAARADERRASTVNEATPAAASDDHDWPSLPEAAGAMRIARQLNSADEAMLDRNHVGMLDPIQVPSPALDLRIEFKLPGSSFVDASPAPKPAANASGPGAESRLARLTVYWPQEGDFYTRNRRSSTGVRLRDGHCAVDPRIIPYGSTVDVPGVGRLIAVDTGSAVVSRRAARRAGRTREQRNAIVVDVFCSNPAKARALAKRIKHFTVVTWRKPERLSAN